MKLVISLLLAAASLPFARAAGDAVDPISYLRTGHGHGHGGGGLQVFDGDDCTRGCGLTFQGCLFKTGECYPFGGMTYDLGKGICADKDMLWCAPFGGDAASLPFARAAGDAVLMAPPPTTPNSVTPEEHRA